ncbi:hypothetical protein CAPTEDRAFT_200712 [Capitella teleta]|uniref:DUF4371 domain-containing protein n=1 Tax=Capitella teleta TaxID=283909 RepID=R7V0N0_CAPTE|nr:hypothetical protein CAPTEDRAFT_200712 [Capitella teleta]|eukprot:ELU09236.1 hypothetical protein CAPTEDRAFT_200712 [Capitella teleta]
MPSMNILGCSSGCKADDIVVLLKTVLKDKKLDLAHLIAVSCDGAAVMQGKDNGVVKKLRDEIPLLLHTHCFAAKLALASSQAANDVTYLRSPKRTRNCQEIQKALDEKVLKYQQVFGTHWLSLFKSVTAISETYKSLVTSLQHDFEEEETAKAGGLLKKISTYEFVATTFFLLDVLTHLYRACLVLQTSNLTYASASDEVDSLKKAIASFEEQDGIHFKNFLASVSEDQSHQSNDEDAVECKVYNGHQLTFSKKQETRLMKTKKTFRVKLVANLSSRFSGDGVVVDALEQLFNNQRTEKNTEEWLKALAKHFGRGETPFIQPTQLMTEWEQFRHIMAKCGSMKIQEFW